ncbi:MAG: hypothetical protein AB9919_06945 [Geobacteraceae bacterium]
MAQQNKTEIVITALNQTQQAFRELKSQFSGLNKDLEGIKTRFPNFAAMFSGLAVSAIAATIVSEFRSIVDELDEISKASQRAGLSVEEFTKLKFAGTVSDASVEQITQMSGQLSAVIVKAKEGNKEISGLFKAINVDISDSRRTYDILVDIAKVLSRMEDGYAKTALAKKLFGKAGAELLPFLNSLNDELGKTNVKISAETALAAEVFNDNWTRMANNAKSFGYTLAADVLPFLVLVTNKMEEISRSNAFKAGGQSFLAGMFPELAMLIRITKGGQKNTVPNFRGMAAGAYGSAVLDLQTEQVSPELLALLKFFENQGKDKGKGKGKTGKTAKELPSAYAMMTSELKAFSTDMAKWWEDDQKKMAEDAEWISGQKKTFTDAIVKMLEDQQQLKEAEIQQQLAVIDTAEAYHQLSQAEAADQRLALHQQLLTVQQQWLGTMDKATDASGWLAQSQAIEETRRRILELSKAVQAKSQNMAAGFGEGLKNYKETIPSLFESSRDAAQGFLQDTESGFKDLFGRGLRGELNSFADFFQSTLNSMIDMFAEMMAQMTMASFTGKSGGWGDLLGSIGGMFGGGGADVTIDGVSTMDWLMNAKGNVFASPSLSQYSGQVVSKPTFFKFAYGAGVMGEGSDPEGIFPLARDKSGKLGVRAMGAGGVVNNSYAANVPITIENGNKALTAELRREVEDTVIQVLRRHS